MAQSAERRRRRASAVTPIPPTTSTPPVIQGMSAPVNGVLLCAARTPPGGAWSPPHDWVVAAPARTALRSAPTMTTTVSVETIVAVSLPRPATVSDHAQHARCGDEQQGRARRRLGQDGRVGTPRGSGGKGPHREERQPHAGGHAAGHRELRSGWAPSPQPQHVCLARRIRRDRLHRRLTSLPGHDRAWLHHCH